MGGRPLLGSVETGAAIEVGRVAAGRGPGAGGLGEVAVHPPAVAVGFQPGPQPGPLPQQRLMGNLHRVTVGGDQPPLDQGGEHGVLRPAAGQLGPRRPAAQVIGGALAGGGEPEKHLPGSRLALGVE